MARIITRVSVFIHPIADKEQFNIAYNQIAEKTNKFFDDDPGPISRNIYWYHENKFTLFKMTLSNGELTYDIPEQLYEMPTSRCTPSTNDYWAFHVTNKKQ